MLDTNFTPFNQFNVLFEYFWSLNRQQTTKPDKHQASPLVSLISSSRFFMYAKALTIDSDRSSNLLNSTSSGFSFSVLAS